MSFLQVRDLTKRFGHLKAVDQVDFELESGKSIAIFGGNGAGKTTLIKIIATLIQPTSGTVLVDNSELKKNSNAVRADLGLISHSLFLYSDLNALENLRYFGRLYGVENLDMRIEELLSKFGLLPRMYDPARTYSRGMLQRLALARAVIHEPKLLLLDEPFTGLDRSAAHTLMDYMGEHKSSGGTTLLVTHNLERGYKSAEKLAVMTNGKMVWSGDSHEVSIDEFKKIYSDNVAEADV